MVNAGRRATREAIAGDVKNEMPRSLEKDVFVKTQYVSFVSRLGMQSEISVHAEGTGSVKSENRASRSRPTRLALCS